MNSLAEEIRCYISATIGCSFRTVIGCLFYRFSDCILSYESKALSLLLLYTLVKENLPAHSTVCIPHGMDPVRQPGGTDWRKVGLEGILWADRLHQRIKSGQWCYVDDLVL
jgi:hypothetical protein